MFLVSNRLFWTLPPFFASRYLSK